MQNKNWDEIDKWAEQTGKHIRGGCPLSGKRISASTKDYDRLWQKLLREDAKKNCMVQL